MTTEIQLLRKAVRKKLTVVEKATNLVWTEEDLGGMAGDVFAGEDGFSPPPAVAGPVSAPYPGCFAQYAAPADAGHFRLVGQTRHFLIFASAFHPSPAPLPG